MKTSPAVIQWWKELRSVLPIWAIAMLMLWLCSATDLFGTDRSAWQIFILVAGSTIVCTLIYTREFQDRTLIWQYLQPVNRVAVLGRKFAVAVVLQAVFCSLFLLLVETNWNPPWVVFGSVGMVLLVSVTSCCLWGILIRNPVSAMVVSVLVPLVLSALISLQLEMIAEKIWMSSPDFDRGAFMVEMVLGALATYGLVSGGVSVFVWRRLQFTGEFNTVSKLDVGVTACLIGDRTFRQLPAWFTLVRKEIGLLRYMAWITGVFLVGAMFFLVVDRTFDHLIAAASSKLLPGQYLPLDEGVVWWQSGLRGIAAALFALQLTLVPMLCGALAFTEEAYLGNRAWQLCQPVRSHWQCLIKFATAFGVSVFAGLVLPAVELVVCSSPFGDEIVNPSPIWQTVTLHFLLFSVAAWCATWSRASFTSVVKAFLLVTGFIFVTTVLTPAIDAKVSLLLGYNLSPFGRMPDWRWPAWGLTLLATAATLLNFRSPDLPTRRWVGQGAAFAALVLLLAVVLFRLG